MVLSQITSLLKRPSSMEKERELADAPSTVEEQGEELVYEEHCYKVADDVDVNLKDEACANKNLKQDDTSYPENVGTTIKLYTHHNSKEINVDTIAGTGAFQHAMRMLMPEEEVDCDKPKKMQLKVQITYDEDDPICMNATDMHVHNKAIDVSALGGGSDDVHFVGEETGQPEVDSAGAKICSGPPAPDVQRKGAPSFFVPEARHMLRPPTPPTPKFESKPHRSVVTKPRRKSITPEIHDRALVRYSPDHHTNSTRARGPPLPGGGKPSPMSKPSSPKPNPNRKSRSSRRHGPPVPGGDGGQGRAIVPYNPRSTARRRGPPTPGLTEEKARTPSQSPLPRRGPPAPDATVKIAACSSDSTHGKKAGPTTLDVAEVKQIANDAEEVDPKAEETEGVIKENDDQCPVNLGAGRNGPPAPDSNNAFPSQSKPKPKGEMIQSAPHSKGLPGKTDPVVTSPDTKLFSADGAFTKRSRPPAPDGAKKITKMETVSPVDASSRTPESRASTILNERTSVPVNAVASSGGNDIVSPLPDSIEENQENIKPMNGPTVDNENTKGSPAPETGKASPRLLSVSPRAENENSANDSSVSLSADGDATATVAVDLKDARQKRKDVSGGRSPKSLIPDMRRPPTPGNRRQPTPGNRLQPTPGNRLQPTPGNRRQPTPGNRRQPTPDRQRQPTPDRRRQPTPDRRRQPTPGGRRQPTPDRRRQPTPDLGRRPAADLGRSPTPDCGKESPTNRIGGAPVPVRACSRGDLVGAEPATSLPKSSNCAEEEAADRSAHTSSTECSGKDNSLRTTKKVAQLIEMYDRRLDESSSG